jgi:HTH-type transcriptional regulator/antitoxin HigA
METLKYTVIKTEKQYNNYCNQLEVLGDMEDKSTSTDDEIELLTMLIEKWDEKHNTFEDADPVEVLNYLMEENGLKSKELAEILGVGKSLISEILNYKKGFSKDIIRGLSLHFKLSQEIFNRPYKLKVSENIHYRNASVMNTPKVMEHAIAHR